MKDIDILLQGEGIPDIQLVTLVKHATFRDVLSAAVKHRKSALEGDFLVFFEDRDAPCNCDDAVPHDKGHAPLRLHVHRCRRVTVSVVFNGEEKSRNFGPGATIATVKKWAALKAFEMDPGDAAEHVLQLSGTMDRPSPDTHIGALVHCGECAVAFDLVPLKRVEG